MRLIDADKLMKAMYHRAFETDGDTMWQSIVDGKVPFGYTVVEEW